MKLNIVTHGSHRYELQADGRRVAVVDTWKDAHLFAAAPRLLAAVELIGRIANLESGELSQEEWDEYVAPFARGNEASMMAVLDAIQAIARAALAAVRGEEE